MLSPERWRLVDDLFHEAAELPPEQRARFLAETHADEQIKREVLSLLSAESRDSDSPELLAARVAAHWVEESSRSIVGANIDGYLVKSFLSEGGMGETYLAEEIALRRPVVLKFLSTAFSDDSGRIQRFLEEARAASALNHPNIITVHGTGVFEGRHYIVTEFIDGETVRQRLAKGPMPAADAFEVAIQAAAALCVAHQAGIIHRDIKPANVMIRWDGYVKLIDFGLARPVQRDDRREITRRGEVLGTLDYMAPEQVAGVPVDERADLYSS